MDMEIKALAKIGKGTKRKKRDINLLEVSEEIKSIYEIHKSLKKVANIVKLSPEMVREFKKVNELDWRVKNLIKKGLITSVDICYRISRLGGKDQVILARQSVDRNFSSDDIRAIVKFKKDNPKLPIEKAIEKVIQSKNIKIYVAYLGIEKKTYKKLLNRFARIKDRKKIIKSIILDVVPSEYIAFLDVDGRIVLLKVNMEGLRRVRNEAKHLKIPLSKLADVLVKKYLEKNKP